MQPVRIRPVPFYARCETCAFSVRVSLETCATTVNFGRFILWLSSLATPKNILKNNFLVFHGKAQKLNLCSWTGRKMAREEASRGLHRNLSIVG